MHTAPLGGWWLVAGTAGSVRPRLCSSGSGAGDALSSPGQPDSDMNRECQMAKPWISDKQQVLPQEKYVPTVAWVLLREYVI